MHPFAVFLIVNVLIRGTVGIKIWVDYPYQVSVEKEGFPICSGSIINHRFILTAAQCVYQKHPSDITVRAGHKYLLGGGDTYSADQLICHWHYDVLTSRGDIALIRVAKDIVYNERVQPIRLSATYLFPMQQNAVVTSWGSLTQNIELYTWLYQTNVTLLMQDTCQMCWPVMEGNICALEDSYRKRCTGKNAGDPLILYGELIGIVSYATLCTIDYPDLYTAVYYYKTWIDNHAASSGIQTHPNMGTAAVMFAVSTIVMYLHSLYQQC